MSKQAAIYILCHMLALGALPFGSSAFWPGVASGLWCAAWMITGRLYVMRHGTGLNAELTRTDD